MSDLKGIHDFVNGEYTRNSTLAYRYPKLTDFRDHYLQRFGLTSYLETLRGHEVPPPIGLEVGLFFMLRQKMAPVLLQETLHRIEENYQCRFNFARDLDSTMWGALLNGYRDHAAFKH